MLRVSVERRHDRAGGQSSLPECLAERDTNDGPDDRVADDPDLAEGNVVDGWADNAHQAHRARDQQAVAYGHMPRHVEHGSSEEESQAEEDVPCDDVDAVEHRWPMPIEEV